MADTRKVLRVLQEARELVSREWGSKNLDLPVEDAMGAMCASVAIKTACMDGFGFYATVLAAHIAFLRGAGVAVPDDDEGTFKAAYDFNDAQPTVQPVLAAFDKAIATIKLDAHLDSTPNADACLSVMAACETAGEIVARQIVAEHPEMDLREVMAVASDELFYAAQDTAVACSRGTAGLA